MAVSVPATLSVAAELWLGRCTIGHGVAEEDERWTTQLLGACTCISHPQPL
jgi:hypothetical protein